MWRTELPVTLLVGLGAGLFAGLVGVGGSFVLIIVLVALGKLTQHQAHGTSLVVLVFTGLAGAATYAIRGAVDVPAAIALAAPAILTAPFGARFAHRLPEWKLKRAFGWFLVGVSVLVLLKGDLPGPSTPATGALGFTLLAAAGALNGYLAGMLGVGGGTLMVPALVLLGGFGQHVAQGTSLLAMVPTGVAGARAHWQLRNVVTPVLPGLVVGVFVGAYLGGSAAGALDDRTLRVLFALVSSGLALRLCRARPADSEGRST
jgi:uncharacterized membrane protein YfcA